MAELAAAWGRALELVATEVPQPSFDAWLKSSHPVAVHDDLVIVAVPNYFAKNYLEGKMAHRLSSILSLVLQRNVNVDFVVPSDARATMDAEAATVIETAPGPAIRQPEAPDAPQPLNPRYVFDTFVVGQGNRLAHAAALAVSEAPAKAYNPLFIYGGVGLGKTHLMHAIAHHILEKNPRSRAVYVSSETFTNEFINAIRDGRQLWFRSRYRNVDILLIDDIQFIAGKETTQEEFFHTFNTLHEARRQIVLSSDRPPKEIPTIEDRLRSRFEWGLISDIQAPDMETRLAILRKKAQLESLAVPDDVLQYIADKIDTNIRELEGALIRLVAFASFHHQELSMALAETALQDILPQNNRPQITIRLIQEAVAKYYDLDMKDFKIRRRTRSISFPRQIAMYLARQLTDNSLPRIGQEFGGRDHTTVMHACDKITQELRKDQNLAAAVNALRKKILSQ